VMVTLDFDKSCFLCFADFCLFVLILIFSMVLEEWVFVVEREEADL
jgi:hypothetical protein